MSNSTTLIFTVVILLAGCKEKHDTIDSGYVKILGTNIYYEQKGDGAPVLLLSGGGFQRSVRDFDLFIPFLPRNYKIITPDSPGQGKSDQPDTLSYPLLAEYFSQLIDSLHLDSVYVIGWSDGGIAALMLADKRPDKVKKVIAVGANYTLSGALPPGTDVNTVKPMLVDKWEENNKEVVERYKKQPNRDWKKMYVEFTDMWYQEQYFPRSVLTNIKIPTLILLGDRDDITAEHALEMHRLIKNSDLCILPNTTHEVFSDRNKLMSEIAMDFFKK